MSIFVNFFRNTRNFFQRRHERHYAQSKMHLALDVVLIILVCLLAAANIFLWLAGGRGYIERVFGRQFSEISRRAGVRQEQTSQELLLEARPVVEAFGQKIGLGPHPPRVGEESTYWIFLRLKPTISNSRELENRELDNGKNYVGNYRTYSHELADENLSSLKNLYPSSDQPISKITNVVVRGALAHNVKWTGRVSTGTGTASACSENCEFRWTIGDLETAAENSLFSSLDAAFELALTPLTIQAEYPLLRYLEVTGKDEQGKQLKTVITDMNTDGL